MTTGDADIVKLRADDVVWRQVGDEVMILDTASSEYLSVNRTGAVLWPLLLEGCTRQGLATALVEQFQLDEATASADAGNFLASLAALKLIEVSAPGSDA